MAFKSPPPIRWLVFVIQIPLILDDDILSSKMLYNFDLHLHFLPIFFLGWKFCVVAMFWDE